MSDISKIDYSMLIRVTVIRRSPEHPYSNRDHLVYSGTSIKTLFDAIGIPTKERDAVCVEHRTTWGVQGSADILHVMRYDRDLGRSLLPGDRIHIDPPITE